LGISAWGTLNFFFFRQRSLNKHRIPREEPFLMLGNHISAFDPFWAGYGTARPLGYMASAQLFRHRFLGALLGALGAFPKVKFVKDKESMATLHEIYMGGRPVTLFPEGTRSWDGRTQKILPGIGRLIKRMDARVVFVRNLSGHLFHPRWAKYPRYITLVLDYSEARTWPPEATVEEIVADVQAAITIDPDVEPAGFAWAFRPAWGLPDYLWACPSCFKWRGLQVDPKSARHVVCRSCEARWEVTAKGWLERDEGRVSIARAFDAIAERYGELPCVDRARFEEDGVLLEGHDVSVGSVKRGSTEPKPLASGTLQLHADRLVLVKDGDEVWSLAHVEIKAISVEFLSVLQVRTEDVLYQVDPTQESTFTWSWFLRPWRAKARGDTFLPRLPPAASPHDGEPEGSTAA